MQPHIFVRLSKLLRLSPRTNAPRPGRKINLNLPYCPYVSIASVKTSLHRLPCMVVGPFSIMLSRRQIGGRERQVNEKLKRLSIFLSDQLHTPMLLGWTMENNHLFSSFASAGSRKRRRSRIQGQSMTTNSRTTKRKKMLMFLIQSPHRLSWSSTIRLN